MKKRSMYHIVKSFMQQGYTQANEGDCHTRNLAHNFWRVANDRFWKPLAESVRVINGFKPERR